MSAPGFGSKRSHGDSNHLRWQSWAIIAITMPFCTAVAAAYAVKAWTATTRTALIIAAVFAMAVWLARAATRFAVLTGGVLTCVLALFPATAAFRQWWYSGVPPLLALFLLTFAATRFGRSRKESLGLAEGRHGRNAAQVTANLGIAGAAAAAVLALSLVLDPTITGMTVTSSRTTRFISWSTLCSTIVAAVLAEATADTLSSEMGEVLGGEPILITTWKHVPPGTDGAVSLLGTLAGGAGALIVLYAATLSLRLSRSAAFAAGVGACAGFFFDSLLGATAERRRWLNNDAVNFLSTAAAAFVALLMNLLVPSL